MGGLGKVATVADLFFIKGVMVHKKHQKRKLDILKFVLGAERGGSNDSECGTGKKK